jgi:hypothetical protein
MMISDAIAAVMADLNLARGPRLATLIGERHLGENDIWPRVVWIPTTDEFGPPRLTGGTPRPLWDLVATYAVHLWEESIEKARQLEMDVIASMHRVMHYADAARSLRFRPTGATWRNDGELQTAGVQLELTVAFTLVVTDRPQTTTTPARVTAALSESDTGGTVNTQVP